MRSPRLCAQSATRARPRYYCHTAFEFVTTQLGAQGTVLGGGRYDGLMALLGGPDIPAVGWAAGIERLAMLLAEPPAETRPVAIIPVGEVAEMPALKLTQELRRAGFTVDLGYGGNAGKRMKRANKINARVALILGEDELARGAVMLRDLTAASSMRSRWRMWRRSWHRFDSGMR